MRIPLALGLLIVVSACAPRMAAGTDDTVTYFVRTGIINNNMPEASANASAYCKARGFAGHTMQSMEDFGNRSAVTFRCK
ncbi:hypothetical protein SAMN05421508_11049 [Caenispirillum bisanense]|uniref:Lipoprotein n=1 Tax=Caenispirillum bisanense TaxID=414052 RepID=A0A286GWE6_9PROT|nr:hypothetical protein SAMN05421508_11049 [Caenispirillum bisanense]